MLLNGFFVSRGKATFGKIPRTVSEARPAFGIPQNIVMISIVDPITSNAILRSRKSPSSDRSGGAEGLANTESRVGCANRFASIVRRRGVVYLLLDLSASLELQSSRTILQELGFEISK